MGKKFIYMVLVLIVAISGCKKWVQVSPPVTNLTNTSVYSNDATAIAVLTGLYTSMSSQGLNYGITAMSLLPGLSADELAVYGNSNATDLSYYQNALTNSNTGPDFWNSIYNPLIYTINSAIQGLASSSGLTPAVKDQLTGEAYFMRAFCYFYLVNLYGDVPLVTSTDYSVNALLSRTPQAKVWQQIVADLRVAQSQLSANYLDGSLINITTERLRPTQAAASALLARTYLYQQKWDSAMIEASAVINDASVYHLESLDTVFLAISNEAIWQLQPVNPGQNTQDALLFVLPQTGPDGFSYPVYMNPILTASFEQGDQRLVHWVDSIPAGGVTYYYPYKYKALTMQSINNSYPPPTEYSVVLRLGEQVLIRAEAKAWLNDLTGAAADLNTIRVRAGLDSTTAVGQAALLNAIYHERQVELFTEWGHRWFDLKRTGNANTVMGSPGNVCQIKSGRSWNPDWQFYPVSLYELQHDPNLVQNDGY